MSCHVGGVSKAAMARNGVQLQIGLHQELLYAFETNAIDFGQHGTANLLTEATFECSPGKRNLRHNIARINAVAGMATDEGKSDSNVPIFDGQRVGGTTRDDAIRWHDDGRIHGPALHQPIQHGRGLEPDPFRIQCNARKARLTDFAEHFIVIDTDHRQFLRNRDA